METIDLFELIEQKVEKYDQMKNKKSVEARELKTEINELIDEVHKKLNRKVFNKL